MADLDSYNETIQKNMEQLQVHIDALPDDPQKIACYAWLTRLAISIVARELKMAERIVGHF